MSLFPAVLVALSLLGLLGQYPETYDAIVGYLREVPPASVVDPLDRSLRGALQSKGPAATALVISVAVALYGASSTRSSAGLTASSMSRSRLAALFTSWARLSS